MVQTGPDEVNVQLVPADAFSADTENEPLEKLDNVFGERVRTRVKKVARIPLAIDGTKTSLQK